MPQKSAPGLSETYERSRAPLYEQVAATLRSRIQEGRWQPGDKISTLEELESEFQVARVTVRQAVELLQKEGLVRRQQGKGTFVTSTPPDSRWLKLATEWDTLIANIKNNVPRMLPIEGAPPEPQLKPGDGIPCENYVFLKSLQIREGKPYAFARVHVDKALFDRDPERFRTRTALSVLATQKRVKIVRASQTFVIGAAGMETAPALGLALNAPTANAHCVVVDDRGIAIYVADIVYRGDCVMFDIDLLNAHTE
ncbi:MAG: GntR family transcriptional regulator [Gammaproteobacteria bacterium]